MTSTIHNQLGEAWGQLHPNVQERFAHDPEAGEEILYTGTIDTTCSFAGCIFACLTRLIGNPLTPYKGKAVPLDVRLYHNNDSGGVCWERTYRYAGRKPFIVTSTKKESAHGEMLECVGGGFGMVLKVTAEEGDLHFRSTRYFCQIGSCRITLPHCITPGESHVIHHDMGGGEFTFTIRMRHKILGITFYQHGIFRKGE